MNVYSITDGTSTFRNRGKVRQRTNTGIGVAAVLLFFAGCHSGPPRTEALGEAYVGPAILKIRSDINPQTASTVASVKHGERLEILQKRRSFFRVRTPNGAEGWTDERQLLASADMANLKLLFERAAKLPSQGQATSFSGDLRIHTLPSSNAPSFLLVKEGDKIEVLTHLAMPRTSVPRSPLLAAGPKKTKAADAKKKKPSKLFVPPMPKPPPVPADWLDLSKTDPSEEPVEPAESGGKPLPTDDWSLVRTAGKESGWVLTRRIRMAISDEVAQYAEGRRIVSYFPLASVQDGDQKKPVWLWTTVTDGTHPFDFDSLRVFTWSLRHHRYETAYIERNLQGYQPVLVGETPFTVNSKTGPEKFPGFSVCLQKNDGLRYRREYALLTNIVRFAGERPCEAVPPAQTLIPTPAPSSALANGASAPPAAATPAAAPREAFLERVKKRLRGWFGK
jgi:hypothetical protein